MFIVSVLVGGVAAYVLGVIWYMALSKPWMAAAKLTEEDIGGGSSGGMTRGMAITYGLTLIMWLVASFILHAHLLPMVESTGTNVFRAVIGMWIVFGLLSTILSTMYGIRGKNLIWIDAGYVLGGTLLITLAYTFIAP